MNGEIVHTLFTLFDQGIAVNLPGQVFDLAIDFFQGLVDGHCADGHGRVTQDPFAGGVNIFSG